MTRMRLGFVQQEWVAIGLALFVSHGMAACGNGTSTNANGSTGAESVGGQAGAPSLGESSARGGDNDTPAGGQTPTGPDAAGGMPEGGVGGSGQLEQLTVVATHPVDTSLEAQPDESIVITFDRPLNPASITHETVAIRDVFLDTFVPAQLSIERDSVTLTPGTRLSLVAEYAVTVDASVAAADGSTLGDDFSFSFTVRDGSWRETKLATNQITFLSSNLGLDEAGTAFVSWVSMTPPNVYCPTTVRRVPLLGEPDEPLVLTPTTFESDCRIPRTAAAGIDLAATSWEEDTGVHVRQYRGGEWLPSAVLTPQYSYSRGKANLVVSPTGVVHLLVCANNATVARHTSPSGEWLPEADVLSSDVPRSNPAVAFEPDGDAFAAWRSADANKYEMILVSSYSQAGSEWSAAIKLPGSLAPEATPTYFRGAPAVAMSAAGAAVVVWVRGAEPGGQLYASSYSSGEWQPPVPVSAEGGLVFQEPPGLVELGGDFVVAWNQKVTGINNTYTARLSQGTWSEPQLRSDGVRSGLSRMPRLGVDAHHNLLLAWPRSTETAGVYEYVHARYLQSTGQWYEPIAGIPTLIADKYLDESAGDLSVPNYSVALPFAVAPNGIAAAAFASRPDHALKQPLEDPILAMFH